MVAGGGCRVKLRGTGEASGLVQEMESAPLELAGMRVNQGRRDLTPAMARRAVWQFSARTWVQTRAGDGSSSDVVGR
jgi:hypothetical protein